MALFVVTYDLRQKDWPDYTKLIDKLKQMSSVKYQESSWFVDQNRTAQQVLETLKPYVHEDDRLMVVEFTKRPAWTKAFLGTKAWLDARFP